MKTIKCNPLGNTQREQWHSVVHILRIAGGDMDAEGRKALCDELDRYIDGVEDIFDKERAKAAKKDFCESVEHIERVYTGGGIYVYAGKLKDGRYFFGDEVAEITTEDLSAMDDLWETIADAEWYEAHEMEATDIQLEELWDALPDDIKEEL